MYTYICSHIWCYPITDVQFSCKTKEFKMLKLKVIGMEYSFGSYCPVGSHRPQSSKIAANIHGYLAEIESTTLPPKTPHT